MARTFRPATHDDFENPDGDVYHEGCHGKVELETYSATCVKCYTTWRRTRIVTMDADTFGSIFYFRPFTDSVGLVLVWKIDVYGRFYTSLVPRSQAKRFEKVKF